MSSGSKGPFSGLVICVTGLSKDARKQVMDATSRLGGVYSPHLHPQCTHLVVQSFHGPKFQHASKLGLSIVTLGWFVDSVQRNARLSESLYKIRFIGDFRAPLYNFDHVIHEASLQNATNQLDLKDRHDVVISEEDSERLHLSASLRSCTFYIDELVSVELKDKVIEAISAEGATLVGEWFVGSRTSHVVCEESSLWKYLGHSGTLVTPLWVLKTVKEKHVQRLVHLPADLARQTGTVLQTVKIGTRKDDIKSSYSRDAPNVAMTESCEVRQKIADKAKDGVRQRRGRRMQTCRTPIRPISPPSLLDAICWSLSEPTSTASIYTDSSSDKDSKRAGKISIV